MLIPKITIRKYKAFFGHSTHTAAEKAVKSLIKPGVHLKLLSTKPSLPSTPVWIRKTPRERLHLRTRELAFLAGHGPLNVTQGEYEQAKREVTGESILSRQNAFLDVVI